MAQEIVTESHTFRSTLDEPREIGHHKAFTVIKIDHAEMRPQGCEVVVCNFGFRIADAAKQGGFTDIRKSDQSHIGYDLQFQAHKHTLAGLTGLCIVRRLHSRCGEVHIADASAAAAQYDQSPVFTGHIGDYLSAFIVANHSSLGNANHEILSVGTVAALFAAGLTVFRDILPDVTEIRQGIQTVIDFKNDIAASAAVTAVRTAGRHI